MPSSREKAAASTRRRFLLSAAVASSLAGCTGRDAPTGGTTTNDATETTDRAAETTVATASPETAETGHEPRPETPKSEAVRWRVAFDAPLAHAPAVGDGAVYVPVGEVEIGTTDGESDAKGSLAALSAADGAPRWTADLPAPPMASPRVHDGSAFCVAGGSSGFWGTAVRLLRFGPDGTERWRTDPVDQFLNVLAFGGDRAYLATSDDAFGFDGQKLFAVGLEDGETDWSVESGDAFRGRYLDGTLLVGPGGGRAAARHDAATGERRWSRKVGALSSATDSFVVADGALLAESRTDGESAFAAVELSDGTDRWTYAEAESADRPFVPTGAAVAGDAVIGTEYDGAVFALDATDGTERWTFRAEGQTRRPPVAADGTVYVGAYNDAAADVVHALDPATGEERWRAPVPGFASDVLAAGDAVVASGGRKGTLLRAFDAADGSVRWTFDPGERLTRPVAVDGRVYVAGQAGVVRALDARIESD